MGDFISRHKPEWDELEQLTQRASKSPKRLSPDEKNRLDVLYRRTTVHLSQVRTRTSDLPLAQYLNSLTAAAHSLIYLPPKDPALKGAVLFVLEGFARTIARQWVFHAISAALLLSGALLAYFAGTADPLVLYALMPAGDPRAPGASPELLRQILRSGRTDGHSTKFLFASFLFSHNLKVGMMCMALGVLAAVPTVLLTVYNGMIMGAFVAVHHQAGIVGEMWAWILPHGITEIGAIILCGGIGLQLGWAVVSPGLKSRGEALRAAAPEVGRTIMGAMLMLIFAAIIESYLRQSHLSTAARLAFAGATALFWIGYISVGFVRERQSRRMHDAVDVSAK